MSKHRERSESKANPGASGDEVGEREARIEEVRALLGRGSYHRDARRVAEEFLRREFGLLAPASD